MIDDLFFIAEVGDPRYRKTAEEVDITQLLKTEIMQREDKDPKKQRSLSSRLLSDQKPLKIIGDPILLKRLFRNALQNARRYATTSVEVSIEKIKSEEGFSRARIRVLDDGPGIEPDEAAIFGKRRTRRFSIDRTLSDSEISLGLGSVIMAEIVRVHGGSLSVRNLKEAGLDQTGTELLIELPV